MCLPVCVGPSRCFSAFEVLKNHRLRLFLLPPSEKVYFSSSGSGSTIKFGFDHILTGPVTDWEGGNSGRVKIAPIKMLSTGPTFSTFFKDGCFFLPFFHFYPSDSPLPIHLVVALFVCTPNSYLTSPLCFPFPPFFSAGMVTRPKTGSRLGVWSFFSLPFLSLDS